MAHAEIHNITLVSGILHKGALYVFLFFVYCIKAQKYHNMFADI